MGKAGKNFRRLCAAAVFLSVLTVCTAWAPASAAWAAELARARSVIPVGRAVGIKLYCDGVLVVGLSGVETAGGKQSPGKACGLKTGDVITHINGSEVDTIEQVQQLLAQAEGETLTIRACRGDRSVQLTAKPVENEDGVSQLGVWLRDSMAGIGTMTFYDPESGCFAALGHGVTDVDTASLMPLESGAIMPASVRDVKKGQSGQPGELHGNFDLTKELGSLWANTERGIFGTADGLSVSGEPVEIARREEVRTGKATILSNVRGEQVEEFEVELLCVEHNGSGTRNMLLKVTDPELLELTGGIVQGMSGSPIIQDGKMVGAVTHVLVNDPTRGYGIFIENMLEAAK
jgi:stage IV sporulation protein B